MSRKPEQKLWDRLREARPPGLLLERMENAVGEGRPDVDALFKGLVTPTELKRQPLLPAKIETPVFGDRKGLSVEQRNWHLRWSQHGGRSLIIAEAGTWLFAWDGRHADEFNDAKLEKLLLRALWSAQAGGAQELMMRTMCSRHWRG